MAIARGVRSLVGGGGGPKGQKAKCARYVGLDRGPLEEKLDKLVRYSIRELTLPGPKERAQGLKE